MEYEKTMRSLIDEYSNKFRILGEEKVRADILTIINLSPREEALSRIIDYLGGERDT